MVGKKLYLAHFYNSKNALESIGRDPLEALTLLRIGWKKIWGDSKREDWCDDIILNNGKEVYEGELITIREVTAPWVGVEYDSVNMIPDKNFAFWQGLENDKIFLPLIKEILLERENKKESSERKRKPSLGNKAVKR